MVVVPPSWEAVEAVESGVRDILQSLGDLRAHAGSPGKASIKPAIDKPDDLRWLLDKEPDLAKAAASNERAAIAQAAEETAQVRIQLGTLRNTTLRRVDKLAALEEELRLLRQDARDTPAETREAAARVAKYEETKARVEQMDQLGDDQLEYTLTLDMLQKRLTEAKLGQNDVLDSLREQAKAIELRTQRQTSANGPVVHAAWQARNATGAQERLTSSQARARAMMEAKRRRLLTKAEASVVSASADLDADAAERRRRHRQSQVEEQVAESVQALKAEQVATQLRKLEDKFRRVQELMGFDDIDSVVERVVAQQQAGNRVEQAKGEVLARHERLIELRARMATQHEEQVGGVDSELTKRRQDYNTLVEQDDALQVTRCPHPSMPRRFHARPVGSAPFLSLPRPPMPVSLSPPRTPPLPVSTPRCRRSLPSDGRASTACASCCCAPRWASRSSTRGSSPRAARAAPPRSSSSSSSSSSRAAPRTRATRRRRRRQRAMAARTAASRRRRWSCARRRRPCAA